MLCKILNKHMFWSPCRSFTISLGLNRKCYLTKKEKVLRCHPRTHEWRLQPSANWLFKNAWYECKYFFRFLSFLPFPLLLLFFELMNEWFYFHAKEGMGGGGGIQEKRLFYTSWLDPAPYSPLLSFLIFCTVMKYAFFPVWWNIWHDNAYQFIPLFLLQYYSLFIVMARYGARIRVDVLVTCWHAAFF